MQPKENLVNMDCGAMQVATQTTAQVLQKLGELFEEAFVHDGFAEMRVEMRILRRGQKEVILHCGKQYRFVVDYLPSSA